MIALRLLGSHAPVAAHGIDVLLGFNFRHLCVEFALLAESLEKVVLREVFPHLALGLHHLGRFYALNELENSGLVFFARVLAVLNHLNFGLVGAVFAAFTLKVLLFEYAFIFAVKRLKRHLPARRRRRPIFDDGGQELTRGGNEVLIARPVDSKLELLSCLVSVKRLTLIVDFGAETHTSDSRIHPAERLH